MARRSLILLIAVTATIGCLNGTFAKSPASTAQDGPKIVAIEVFPTSLDLTNIRDGRRLIVTGKDAAGIRYDLTQSAKLTPAAAIVSIDADGYIEPKAKGETTVTVQAAGLKATVKVHVRDVSPRSVDFATDIMPTISKVGCNAGTCHGARKGKAGFKLSLRGYDSLYDYRALVDDLSGRRFNRSQPAQSLMLLKPTQGVPHGGGFLFDEDSRYYKLIEQWIAEGCRYKRSPRAVRIDVTPSKPLLQRSDAAQQLIVIAHFPDGSTRDVTRDAVFKTTDFEVATVSKGGRIQAVRRGEASMLIRYEGLYAAVPIAIIGNRKGYRWMNSPEYNFVDTHVNNKLKRLKDLPSDLCTDAEFLRRISLDLTGLPPSLEQTRAFLADKRDSRTKRTAKIDELLGSPGYVDHWTLKWADLLLNNRKFVTEKGVWGFRNWIRNSVAQNKPYNKFAYELLTAGGSTFENPAANYYRIAREPRLVMENMTQVFLGTRFQCNRCHDHPFERWTRDQYYQLSAYFAGVGRKKGILPGEEIITTLRTPPPVIHPGTNLPVSASVPFDSQDLDPAIKSRRKQIAHWLTGKGNDYFAKSLVNRYWSYFFGLGIIDPVDDIRATNPPTNPELLEALTKDFTSHGYDLKRLVRLIVSSHTYQRSYRTNRWNEDDKVNFSHAQPRRLAAEQLFDAIMIATGAPANLPGVPAGFRAEQLPDSKVNVRFLDMFGRAPRESPCECERSSTVSLGQTLNLVNGPTISNAIEHPQGLIARLVKAKVSDQKLVESIYLSVVCRYPTKKEAATALAYVKQVKNPTEAGQDLMWALINSPEFLFNR